MKESDFQFLGYRVSKVVFEVKDDYNPRLRDFSQSINMERRFLEDDKRFVEVVLNISLEDKNKDFSFFLSIKGGFQAHENMPEDLFQTMSKQNAPAILYPFARAIITNYTAQANIPPIILPALSFAEQKEIEDIKSK